MTRIRRYALLGMFCVLSACGRTSVPVGGGETAKARSWRMIGPLEVPGGYSAVLHSRRTQAGDAVGVVRDVLVVMRDGRAVRGTVSIDCRSGAASWTGPLASPSEASGLAGTVLALGCLPDEGGTTTVRDAVASLAERNAREADGHRAFLNPS